MPDFSQQYQSPPSYGLSDRQREMAQQLLDAQSARNLEPQAIQPAADVQDEGRYLDQLAAKPLPQQDDTTPENAGQDPQAATQGIAASAAQQPARVPGQVAGQPTANDASSDPQQSSQDMVKQYLTEKYGLNNDALKAAQQAQVGGVSDARKGEAFATIGAALAGSPNVQVDKSFYNKLANDANLPVNQVLQMRGATEQNMHNEAQINELAKKQVEEDPNSDINKGFQAFLKKAVPGLANVPGADNITLASSGPFEKIAALYMQDQDKKLQIAAMAQQKQMMMQFQQEKVKGAGDAALGKNVENLTQRGTLKEAGSTIRRADNALSLINGDMKQLNSLTPQQVDMFYQEVDGMINGGAPTIIGARGITPETWNSIIANGRQKFANNPTGAGLGAFIQQMKPYLIDVRNNAAKMISDAGNNLADSSAAVTHGTENERQKALINKRYAPMSADAGSVSGMVKIRTPDGRTGSIPAEKLQDALAHGAKQVQ